jgi:DNA-binding transcriptional LysR family regulator
MDRLDAMAVFLAVADGGSLSAAARKLAMPLATVSRKLADLESHLKARLFVRTTRKLGLTDAGRDYAAACRRILDEVGEAERTVSGEYRAPQGELVVTAPIVFGRLHVLPVIAEFLAVHPAVDVRLMLGDRLLDLVDDHVDVAIRIGELPDSRAIATRVGSVRRVVCGSPAYFERHGVPTQPDALRSHDCVIFDARSAPQLWRFEHAGAETLVRVPARLMVNTAEAAIDAAIAGVGITQVISYQAAASLQTDRLQIVLAAYEAAPLPVSLLFEGRQRLPLKLRAFLDFAAPRLRAALAAG